MIKNEDKFQMHLESNQIVFSPSDLTQFMESPFASWMEHLAITHPDLLPASDEKDELLSVLHDMGNQHELEILAAYEVGVAKCFAYKIIDKS